MASVFLSYDRDDAATAKSIARALEKAGHSVWWDRHIKGGSRYAAEIEKALSEADAVVVLWSRNSVQSDWVRDEAAKGRDSGRLVPARIDDSEPPLGFGQHQTIDLPNGRMPRAARIALLDALEAVAVGESRAAKSPKPRRFAPRFQMAWIIAALVFAAIVGAVLFWRPLAGKNELVLAVGPAASDAASQALARDLATKLASLQTTSSGEIRIVEASDEGQDADLVFEATATPGAPANASLVLKSARDSALLWSQDFEQPSGRYADLLQQLAYTAGRVTNCAMEGLEGPVKLKPAPLKTYLNACAQLSEIATSFPDRPSPMLHDVVKDSPRFEPAWSKLLLAEADEVVSASDDGQLDVKGVAELRQHIAEARKINPAMPEAAIAEALLLPATDFTGRAEGVEAAAALSPDDPQILSYLAASLTETGRMREGVEAAAKAVQLDPLSPRLHSSFVAALAYAGTFDAAKRELAKAEKLWPNTDSLMDAQYRFHLRYGDPRIARQIFDEQTDAGGRAPRLYLDARQDPTPENIEQLMAYVRERLTNMENPSAGIGFATLAYGQFGRTEEIFSTLLSWPKREDIAAIAEVLFRPEFREVRQDPRFLRIAQRAGLLDYWRKSGNWPDFCFAADRGYDCKAEAAKLRS